MGAVPVLVAMLKQGAGGGKAAARSEGVYEYLQTSAASALGTLAEADNCRRAIVLAGAVEPLVAIAMFGSDQTKLAAIGALDMLQFNAADVKARRETSARARAAGVFLGARRPAPRADAESPPRTRCPLSRARRRKWRPRAQTRCSKG